MLKVQIPLERLIKVKEPPDTRLFYIIPSFLNGMIKSISTVLYRIVSGKKANPILSELKVRISRNYCNASLLQSP